MKNIAKVSLVASAILLQGCATMFSGTNQTIKIEAVDNETKKPITGCHCTVTDGLGGQHIVTGNPGSATVSKKGSVQVNCAKEGYRQINTAVGESFSGTTILNVFFWPGLIVDAASGAYKKLPSHYLVSMEKIQPK